LVLSTLRSAESTRLHRSLAPPKITNRRLQRYVVLPLENGCDEVYRSLVIGLTQPEYCFLANDRVAILAGLIDQERHTLVAGQLLERKDRFLLYLSLGVVFHGLRNYTCRFLAIFLSKPE